MECANSFPKTGPLETGANLGGMQMKAPGRIASMNRMGRVLCLGLCFWAEAAVRAEVKSQSTVSHDGVTVSFSGERPVGNFIDGYPYVVGKTEIIGYDPACKTLADGRVVNGAMINPECGKESGFDSGGGKEKWKPELNVGAGLGKEKPLVLEPGQSLLIAVSNEGKVDRTNPLLERVVILTCLAEIPPDDAFRPAYANAEKKIYTYSQLKTGLLKNLKVVGTPPSWESVNQRFERFQMDIVPNWDRDHLTPKMHPPLYGRDLSANAGTAYVMVNADFPAEEKKRALIGLVQRGIDHYGVFQSAKKKGMHPWAADGGHHSGRKFSIMFAGALLGEDAMKDVVLQTPYQNLEARDRFQEDVMIFTVEQKHIDISNSPEWKPPYADKRPQQPYSQAMLGMPDWRGSADNRSVSASFTGHPYRISTNNGSQSGQALAALVMGLQPAWRNDAYFDYHARFMEIMEGRPDPWGTQRGAALSYPPVTGSVPEKGWEAWQKNWRDPWVWEMIQHHWKDHYRYPWQRTE